MSVTTSFALPAVASPEPLVVQQAALGAVAYADVFDYPLRASEIHRYLHGVVATRDATAAALAYHSVPGGPLSCREDFYTLRGRENLVEVRRRRAARAERLWPAAIRYGQLMAALPFVRMVAVTGSLAWDNANDSADIDYLIVTEPGRLWLCRLLVRAVARVVRLTGVKLCANYLISERALELPERNLYTAYELVQMVPVAGLATYRRLRELNSWTEPYLPNVFEPSPIPASEPRLARSGLTQVLARAARLGEWVLRSGVGSVLERIEMNYRIRKYRRQWKRQDCWVDMAFGVDCFKGHPNPTQRDTLAAFAERLDNLTARAP